jgi:hypothetical protein
MLAGRPGLRRARAAGSDVVRCVLRGLSAEIARDPAFMRGLHDVSASGKREPRAGVAFVRAGAR